MLLNDKLSENSQKELTRARKPFWMSRPIASCSHSLRVLVEDTIMVFGAVWSGVGIGQLERLDLRLPWVISSAGRVRKISTDANSNTHPEYGLNEKVTFMKKSAWLEPVNATFEIQFCEKARYSLF